MKDDGLLFFRGIDEALTPFGKELEIGRGAATRDFLQIGQYSLSVCSVAQLKASALQHGVPQGQEAQVQVRFDEKGE